jgi:hypothetical protein
MAVSGTGLSTVADQPAVRQFDDCRAVHPPGSASGCRDRSWSHWLMIGSLLAGLTLWQAPLLAQPTADHENDHTRALELFENRIRPMLWQHCYGCHNSHETAEGGLTIDDRQGLLSGGWSGPSIDVTAPDRSLLLQAIEHADSAPAMPKGSPRLPQAVIDDVRQWLRLGAVDPRDSPPTHEEHARQLDWETIRQQRAGWWAFQPPQWPVIPGPRASLLDASSDAVRARSPIDALWLDSVQDGGLAAAPPADPEVLLRRLSYVLTGLQPTTDELDHFLSDRSPQTYERAVDRILASPQLGEHWARHWLDWLRYAETHGSEGDPAIPFAWRYRDYVIRALNRDVPYRQLLIEHIAGDLLPEPRVDPLLGINESAIGPAHWRMVFHGFAPTDPLEEKIRFTDDQINVFSKAFQGLTLACARCHDHKYDPISQSDYYAVFGVLGSTRPGIIDVNLPDRQQLHRQRLQEIKTEVASGLAALWSEELEGLGNRLLAGDYAAAVAAAENSSDLWWLYRELTRSPMQATPLPWSDWLSEDVSGGDAESLPLAGWYRQGNGSIDRQQPAGAFWLTGERDRIIEQILPAGSYSHLISDRHRGVLASPPMRLSGKSDLWLRVAGDGQALVRYVVQDYPRDGTVYPIRDLRGGQWQWIRFPLDYWEGESIHVELTTAADSPVLARPVARSWFGLREAWLVPSGRRPPGTDSGRQVPPLVVSWSYAGLGGGPLDPPRTLSELAQLYERLLREAVQAWSAGVCRDDQAELLQAALEAGLLSNSVTAAVDRPDSTRLIGHLEEYRRLESQIPEPTRVPGVWEPGGRDWPLYVRGEHRQPAQAVPRRYLELFSPEPIVSPLSGRWELAQRLVASDNPLTARVLVNRVWQNLFEQGLVTTPDNFGLVGAEPTHPQLLDYLALRLQTGGWSIKRLLREMLLTDLWRVDSDLTLTAGDQSAPTGLRRAPLRRLTAESLRDRLLQLSGRLDRQMYGPPAGRETGHPRRSIYTAVARNAMNPFLEVFNAPVPFATTGKRDATNVPAQSLALLNDPFVIASASAWADRVWATLPSAEGSDQQRIELLYRQALGRLPTPQELKACESLLGDLERAYAERRSERERLVRQADRWEAERERLLDSLRAMVPRRPERERRDRIALLQPDLWWDFTAGETDLVQGLAVRLHGTARLDAGGLLLDGHGYASSPAIEQPLAEKTLEVWVQLDDLEQRGGAAVAVQQLSGDRFDAIVFGEQHPGRWLAGSDFFRRTQAFSGAAEQLAEQQPVQVVIVWQADGKVTAYRQGELYGESYIAGETLELPGGQWQLLLGLRHGEAAGNRAYPGRLLRGRLLEARLYQRCLSPDQVAELATWGPSGQPPSQLLALAGSGDRGRWEWLTEQLESNRRAIGAMGPEVAEHQAWADLAHALINTKEFLFLR